jgi:hypothetical protein
MHVTEILFGSVYEHLENAGVKGMWSGHIKKVVAGNVTKSEIDKAIK